MKYLKTTAYKKIKGLKKRIRAIQGGTSASKTISILIYLIAKAQSDKVPTLTSVVSESFPHLRRGAMREFLDIMKAHQYFRDARWDKTNSIYTFETESQIEFFSADQSSKVRGPRRDRCFINEANNVPYETFDQLEIRTNEFVIMDWNPTSEFWYYTEVERRRDDVEHIILTYKDNEALNEEVKKAIELRKDRKEWWKVYGLGELGEVEGRIYTGWQIVDEIPHTARLDRRGLDFGYSNDPSALVDVWYYDGGYIWDETLFQKNLSNKQIADIIKNLQYPETLVVADSAEPKSIDELKVHGVNIVGATKGKDSVNYGIKLVQAEKISLTKRSTNIIKEYRNYLWEVDKDGKILPTPEHTWSHSMDAGRYAMESLKKPAITIQSRQSEPLKEYYPELGI